MEEITEVVAEAGVLKGKRRGALDSIVLHDAVATQNSIALLIDAVLRFGRDIPGCRSWTPPTLPGMTKPAPANRTTLG